MRTRLLPHGRRCTFDSVRNAGVLLKATLHANALLGNEADVEAFAQDLGDTAEHGKRVPFVVRVFEPRDNRLVGVDEVSKLGLGHACGGACVVDELSDF